MTNGREVLRQIIETANLDESACATAMGVSSEVLADMLAGRRELPESLVPLMAAILGINEALLTAPPMASRKVDVVPAIWYKLRGSDLSEVDRNYVLSLRQLAFYQHELESVTDSRSVGWQSLFEQLRRETDPQTSPTEQGRQAARLFRRATGLDQGARGIGEVFRGHLRNIGILVIESSAPQSILEGCSFHVGPSGAVRPCVFANSYRTTWFRRNQILLHELAHAIFDVESTTATLDFVNSVSTDAVQETRADAFAQEALVPFEVLRHVAQIHKVNWHTREPAQIARMVAETHVEQRLLATAVLESQLGNVDDVTFIESCNIADELRKASQHALSTEEYLLSKGVNPQVVKGRTTTATPQKLLLPSKYVMSVLEAFKSRVINRGKAARMLMIDEYEFEERFSEVATAA